LRQHEAEFERLDIKVFVITFDVNFLAKAYVQSTGLRWPLLHDADRKLYAAYGMEKLSWWQHYSPVSIAKYLWLTVQGHFPGKPGADWQQLGGDVLIDPAGIVRFLYRSLTPHDRPKVSRILSIIQQGQRG
jgi:AhpC/TSA antioxidant enzyme